MFTAVAVSYNMHNIIVQEQMHTVVDNSMHVLDLAMSMFREVHTHGVLNVVLAMCH